MRHTKWMVRVLLIVSAALIGMRSNTTYGQYAPYGSVAAVDSFGVMWGRQAPPLFNNYFTHGASDQATAAMYISPMEVPGWVGHTYNTYQPLYPHEFMYWHKDRYHSYYDGGAGLNRTKATYTSPPVRSAVKWVHKTIEIPR